MTGVPVWGQVIVGIAAVAVALITLFTKIVRPLYRFAARAEEMLPLMYDLTVAFRDSPQAFVVLHEIVRQFRTDSGSSLRDIVNRLDTAAEDAKRMATEDRMQLQRLVILLDRLTLHIDTSEALVVVDVEPKTDPPEKIP